MNLFDSIVHSFGTAGTGGFGIKSDSLGGYSAYSQWVIAIFMLLFGVNFNLYYLMIIKKFKTAIKSSELWAYIGMVAVACVFICVNIRHLFPTLAETVRQAVFQVASVITTTGYATTDFNLWPSFSKAILLIFLFTGACAGSTAGGLKISRVVLLFKMIAREVKTMIHPRAVATVKFEGKEVDKHTQNSVTTYFAVYILCIFVFFLIISLEPFDFETNFTAAATCFNNVGPGFGMVGPAGSFAVYSDLSKVVLSLAMLMGRLEIFPILIALIPSTWTKR